jgi:hypothetical protein
MPREQVTRLLPILVVAAGLAAGGCGESSKPPTTHERLPDAAALIPTAPAPQPTPTPTPGALPPDDEPIPVNPGGGDTASGGCGEPEPPAVSRINVKVQGRQSDRVLLDATPLVGPNGAYCRKIGFTDGRSYCPVRPEGHPEREACEAAGVGRAADTGRAGPTWSASGKRCSGPDGGASCLNHPQNQYLAYAYGAGVFRACAAGGVCGEITLP